MTTLLLIRHGQSRANLSRYFAGHCDPELTELGLLQARCTADFLAENYPVAAVYSSDLKRAYATGEAVARKQNLPIVVDRDLREIYAGQWEGLSFDEIRQRYAQDYHTWLTDIGNCRPTGGEAASQLLARVESALRRIGDENPNAVVAVATHATAIRAIQSLVSGVGLPGMKDVPWVVNASVTELIYDSGHFALGKVGQAAHLKDLRTDMPANV